MAILEVRDLSAGYGAGDVIRGVSLSIEEGEFVTVLGRNGSGKSTLIKALQRLLKDVRGEARVAGRDLFGLAPRPLARLIAYVPQLFEPVFEFTVEEIILMGRYVHQGRFSARTAGESAFIAEVMKLTQVDHLAGKELANLSGGERQRVFIARAIAQDTPLLFLDEPSSHLDISYQIEVYQILQKLQKERGKTILAAEHNINLAVPYSQKLALLRDGRLEAQGPPRDLVTKENIRAIYDAEVDIRENRYSGLPEISLNPGSGGGR